MLMDAKSALGVYPSNKRVERISFDILAEARIVREGSLDCAVFVFIEETLEGHDAVDVVGKLLWVAGPSPL